MHTRKSLAFIAAVAPLAALAAACSDSPSSPDPNPLAGLRQESNAIDSGGVHTPPPPNSAPGVFRGRVMRYDPGPDSASTANGLAGVRITAYTREVSSPDVTDPGAQVASILSNAAGEFAFAPLPEGEYVVTFSPPASCNCRGVWTTAYANATSGNYPWWVMLAPK